VLAGETERARPAERKASSTVGLFDGWNKQSKGARERRREREREGGGGAAGEQRRVGLGLQGLAAGVVFIAREELWKPSHRKHGDVDVLICVVQGRKRQEEETTGRGGLQLQMGLAQKEWLPLLFLL
jgi:hypothetical protein